MRVSWAVGLLVAGLLFSGVGWASSVEYGDVVLSGGFQAGHFGEIWDLTKGDMYIIVTVDLTGMVDDFGGNAHAWSQLGIRTMGYPDFNPTWMVEGAGVWLCTDYDWTVDTFDPDPPGSPNLDLDDKLLLQKAGGQGEGDYDLPSPPPNPNNNHRFWFDRDGVDQWQAQNPLAVDGGTYNTDGIYQIVIHLHALDATHGVAYLTINGLDQGFETDGDWNTMELTPAGMTFTGDMTQMQVFYGLYGYGAVHTVQFGDLVVILRDVVYVDDDWAGSSTGDPVDGHFFGYDAFATIQEGVDAAGMACEVAPGSYVEQVIITKDVSLHGLPGAVIQAPGSQTYRLAENPNAVYDPIVFVYGGTLTGDLVSGPERVDADVTGFEIDGQNRAQNQNPPIRFVGILYRNANGEISGNTIHSMFDSDGEGDGPETFGILVYGDSTVRVIGNTVSDFSRGGIGIVGDLVGWMRGPSPDPVVRVEGNTVTGNGLEPVTGWWAENGIQIGYGATGEIVGNTVTDCRVNNPSWSSTGILVVSSDGVLVSENRVSENDNGVAIMGLTAWGGQGAVANIIQENDVVGNQWGIGLQYDAINTQIIRNVLVGNIEDAIYAFGWGAAQPLGTFIRYNSISGNGYGLVNYGVPESIDAALNWWGSPDGPWFDQNFDGVAEYAGAGDPVYGDVIFSPWLGIAPDGDPTQPGVQITGPMTIIVSPVGPEPAGGYLNAAIRGANELPYADTIEVRHGTYDASEPITDPATIISEPGSASHTTLTGPVSLAAGGVTIGLPLRGFTVNGPVTVGAGVDASTCHLNWSNLYGMVTNNGIGTFDAQYNYWGTLEEAVIQGRIAGDVDYDPFLPEDADSAWQDIQTLLGAGLAGSVDIAIEQLWGAVGAGQDLGTFILLQQAAGGLRLGAPGPQIAGGAGGILGGGVAGGGGAIGVTLAGLYTVGEPIVGSFTLTDPATGEPVPDALVTVSLLDPGSQLVFWGAASYNESTGEYTFTIDTADLAPGTYQLIIQVVGGEAQTLTVELQAS